MLSSNPLAPLIARGFNVKYCSHAQAILQVDFPTALDELANVLGDFVIPIESLVRGGGGLHELTQALRRKLNTLHWRKHNFVIEKRIDDVAREQTTHEIDHVRRFEDGAIAMEIEWNNKDPFFDRDLENFKHLHAEGAISVGVLLTRGDSLQENLRKHILEFAEDRNIASFHDLAVYRVDPTDRQRSIVERLMQDRRSRTGLSFPHAWSSAFVADKFSQSTTHWLKLKERIDRGVGNPCPLLLLGIPNQAIIK